MDAFEELSEPLRDKALGMLSSDTVAWFTTIGADGAPRAVPVWFLWHDGVIDILSEPDTVKVANVRRDPRVVMHMNAGGPFGDDVLVLRGVAQLAEETGSVWMTHHGAAYVEKYRDGIAAYGMPIEKMAETFSTVITFTPARVLAW